MLLQLHINLYFWVIVGSPFTRPKLWLCATHVVYKHCYNQCILFCWKVFFTSVWPQVMLHCFYRWLQLKICSKCEANLFCYKRNKKGWRYTIFSMIWLKVANKVLSYHYYTCMCHWVVTFVVCMQQI
jgi:hypothetical protein